MRGPGQTCKSALMVQEVFGYKGFFVFLSKDTDDVIRPSFISLIIFAKKEVKNYEKNK